MERKQNMTGALKILLLTVCLFAPLLAACVRLPHKPPVKGSQSASQALSNETPRAARININTASAKELEGLPGIGRGLAARIISHRERYGPFRRAEHLIIVRGIGDRRFRRLYTYVTVE